MSRNRPPPAPPVPSEEEEEDRAERKERVLHTRVPAVLEAELKRFAQNLRIPVSNLVRTILEDAMHFADSASENVESRLKQAAEHLEHERERLKKRVVPPPAPEGQAALRDVIAFNTVTVAQRVSCASCAARLEPGDRAHLGIPDRPPPEGTPRVFVCDDCLPRAH
ncbi:MAG: hypothetical protein U0414_26830 [Polyangiaceae bacterium]